MPATSAGLVVLAYAAQQLSVLQTQEARLLGDAKDAVHQSRVATRRLRSLLKTYARLFDPDRATTLEKELRWYGEILGGPRDAEVLKDHLLQEIAELAPRKVRGPVTERLESTLDARYAAAHDHLLATMAGPRYAALTSLLAAFLADEPLTARGGRPAVQAVHPLLRRAIHTTRTRYRRAVAKPKKLARWHDTRKAVKAVRYCIEAVADAYGERARSAAAEWAQITELLGAAQDTVIACDELTRAAVTARHNDEPRATYRDLQASQRRKRKRLLAKASAALHAALSSDMSWLREPWPMVNHPDHPPARPAAEMCQASPT